MSVEDASFRESLDIHGDVEIGVHGAVARLTGVLVERRDGRVSLRFSGLLRELRVLAGVAPAYAAMLEHVRTEDASREGSLVVRASPALQEELDRAVEALGAAAMPQEWLQDPTTANLLFALDRYEPESVSVVTSRTTLG